MKLCNGLEPFAISHSIDSGSPLAMIHINVDLCLSVFQPMCGIKCLRRYQENIRFTWAHVFVIFAMIKPIYMGMTKNIYNMMDCNYVRMQKLTFSYGFQFFHLVEMQLQHFLMLTSSIFECDELDQNHQNICACNATKFVQHFLFSILTKYTIFRLFCQLR